MKKTSFHEYLIARAGRRLVLEMDEKTRKVEELEAEIGSTIEDQLRENQDLKERLNEGRFMSDEYRQAE